MRMKDVISQTDLTDRAVRLYIENGLVTPDLGETNAGRRSLDFSEADVDSLKKIATLRKAGFSIAEIKKMKNSENCKETVLEFIEKTTLRVETDTRIINSLQSLIEKDEITLDSVCQSLDSPTEKKSVPEEDMKLTTSEKFKKVVIITISSVTLLYCIVTRSFYHSEFIYTKFYSIPKLVLATAVPFILIICYITNIRFFIKQKNSTLTPKRRTVRDVFIVLVIIVVSLFGSLCAFVPYFVPFAYSQTEDANNYLQVDHGVRYWNEDIYRLFPSAIPDSVIDKYSYYAPEYHNSVKYFYRYNNIVEEDFDIVAEWQLPDDEFKAEKERALEDIGEITHQSIKGDWNCIYYDDFDETKKEMYYFKIFAYNERTKTVRYIISYSLEKFEPYYLSIDWE